MVVLLKEWMKKFKLIFLFWTRIIFVRNNFKCSFFKKIKANFFGGFLADQWILYDLDRNNKHEYLSEFDWYRSRYINEPFDYLLNNKVITAEVLKQHIRVPENYVLKSKGILNSFCGNKVHYEDIFYLLKDRKRLFIKPYGVGKGIGVNLLEYKNKTIYIDEKEFFKEDFIDFLKKRDNWFICEAMEQDEFLNNIYDKTINTIRLITFRDIKTQEFKNFFAVQRIGTSKTIPVDNGSKGALVAKIDMETGVLSEARSLHSKESYDKHPNSNSQIKGVTIPNWDIVKKTMLNVSNKMPYLHFIAWDILIMPKGELCVIEANTSSGVNIIQLWGGQRKSELGDFYRFHNVIK